MKFKDYMEAIDNLENGRYEQGKSFEDIYEEYCSYWEEIDLENEMKNRNGGLYSMLMPNEREYSEEQKKVIEEWKSILEDDFLELTPFKDRTFLAEFLKDIPKEEQFEYVKNTNEYQRSLCNGQENIQYDTKYVLVTRRAVPSLDAKPEQFWTNEHKTARDGLRREIPTKTPHRYHSAIMVTSLNTLTEHGEAMNYGGVSDGEICINSKPFDPKKLIFIYKPYEELSEMMSYIKEGGLKNKDFLEILKENAKEREKYLDVRDIEKEEIVENNEIQEDYDFSEKQEAQIQRKGPVQVYDEKGNIIVQDYINPDLMKGKVVLPNGNQITKKQYIQEIVAPRIPESGTFKLKNGIEISARQFIEEYVMFEGQTKYKGDIDALLNDTVDSGDIPPTTDGKGVGMKQEHGYGIQNEEKQTDENSTEKETITGEELKGTLRKSLVTAKEVKEQQTQIKDDKAIKEYKTLRFKKTLGSITPEEQAKMNELLNIQAVQLYDAEVNQRKQTIKKSEQNSKGMGR